ncbi:hypothetical protein GCM10020254_21820 [Streptomyces goshikiensis]
MDRAAPSAPSTIMIAAGRSTVAASSTKGTEPPLISAPKPAASAVPSPRPGGEHHHGLAEGVPQQVRGGGTQCLQDGDVAAALDRPDGEEGPYDQRGDGEEESAHQLERAVLGLVGAYGAEGLVDGQGVRGGGLVPGGEVGGAGRVERDDGGEGVEGGAGVSDALPVAQVRPDDRGVAVGGSSGDGGHRQFEGSDPHLAAGGEPAELLGGLLGEDHRALGQARGARGGSLRREPPGRLDAEHGDGGGALTGDGVGGADAERLRRGHPGPLAPGPPGALGHLGAGEGHLLVPGGRGEGQVRGGQSGDGRDVLPGQSGGEPGQQTDQQRDQQDDRAHEGEPPFGKP